MSEDKQGQSPVGYLIHDRIVKLSGNNLISG